MQVLEGVMKFEDCSPEGESCVAGSYWCWRYGRCGCLTSWSRRERRPQTWLRQWVWPRLVMWRFSHISHREVASLSATVPSSGYKLATSVDS